MKKSIYKNYDELPLMLTADTVANVLGIAASTAYDNSYLTGHNYEEYISKTLLKVFQGTTDSLGKRMARQLFKQSVEISKIFRLIIKELEIDPEDADTLHADCVEEVKKINGAIQFPYRQKSD